MKAKYLVIIILLIVLVIIVYQMIRYEDSIRQERIIEIMVEDVSKPLINKLNTDKLEELALASDYFFLASDTYFEVLNTEIEYGEKINKWEKIFLKGINLGVALPGKFPSEFSLSFEQYLEWFRLIGEMNSNVIRIYTILPPEFYEAFAYYNLLYQNKKLYLLQGVWAKEPDKNNYFNPSFQREFQKEIINVIDLIHGNAVISPEPGKASGTYVSNISQYVIGIILGREWEPKAVTLTNQNNKIINYTGHFISISSANAMEYWLATMMDFTVQYETQTYKTQRPVSFVNWLPLDPMYHSSEFIENEKIQEYDNDLESVDLRKFNTSNLFEPGIFASYHAYPYYPDYIYNDFLYAKGDQDNYFRYLQNLKEYHPGIPLVIAEYGLPSSRGNSHYTPCGLNQGGHSEKQQAELSMILTDDIHKSHCAGAIYFEWIDEWFKHNWLVMDFEQPQERRKYWHNMENPEQNFGILAVESRSKVLDGIVNDWDIQSNDNNTFVKSEADPGYFYLALQLPGFNFDEHRLHIAIDTYSDKKGEHKLPFLKENFDPGIEFLLEFDSPENAHILVDDAYSVYTDIYNDSIPVYSSKNNQNSKFVEQLLLSNRSRLTLSGDTIQRRIHNRSKLVHGKSDMPEFSNSDWYWNSEKNIIEIRLTWNLLNVCDPSSNMILDDLPNTGIIEFSHTSGFNIFSFVTDKNNKLSNDVFEIAPYFFSWEGWEEPEYKIRKKPLYYELQKSFSQLLPIEKTVFDEDLNTEENFQICEFFENKKSAVSLAFNDLSYSQYEYAVPFLKKYKIKASFGVINDWLSDQPGQIVKEDEFIIKRMGVEQLKELIESGHSVAIQAYGSVVGNLSGNQLINELKSEKLQIEKKTGGEIISVFYPNALKIPASNFNNNSGFILGLQSNNKINNINNIKLNNLNSIIIENSTKPGFKEIERILDNNKGNWLIFQYCHIFPGDSKEFKLSQEKSKTIFAISPDIFERQCRIIRNSDFWIAPVSAVGKYFKEKQCSKIKFNKYKNLIFLTIVNDLDNKIFNQPLTIKYTIKNKKIRVTNSAADGIYNSRNGKIYLNIYPNQEVIIEILD